VRRVRGRSRGQGVVEYGLILSLSGLLAIGLLVFAGGTVADVLDLIVDAVDAAEGR
jgi:Flp pilus assembly pilin Flp